MSGFVLITGASSGIGAATARLLASRGRKLLLAARRADRLKAIQDELIELTEVRTVELDVRDQASSELLESTGVLDQVDVLINNAGLAMGVDKMQSADVAHWEAMIDTNIKGLLYVTRAVLPYMIAAGRGHVVNLGSVAGRWVYPGGGVYCATKFAVRALNEGLRMDLMGTPVRVTNVEPGMVETEFSEVRMQDPVRAKEIYHGMTPLSAIDIAESILWCLERPAHVNVQELVIFPTDQAGTGLVSRHRSKLL